jgi:hypothetical protein
MEVNFNEDKFTKKGCREDISRGYDKHSQRCKKRENNEK